MKQMDIFFLGLIAGGLLFYFGLRFIRRKKAIARIKSAKRAESKAIRFLTQQGYSVLDVQKRTPLLTIIDGKPHQNFVQADLIVKKNGKVYVAEVKSGEAASRIVSAPIRRQLLEYYLVYRPHGILYVDMERECVRKVEFSIPAREKKVQLALFFLYGMVLGSGLFYLWSKGGIQ